MTAIPSSEDLMSMRSALDAACRMAASGPVASDLENPHVGFGGAALQIVGLLQLLESRCSLFERQRILLGLDLRQHFVLEHLEFRALERRLGLLQGAVIGRARGGFLRASLANLLFEIVELGLLVEGVAHLLLPIELDQQVARVNGPPGLDQRGHDQ